MTDDDLEAIRRVLAGDRDAFRLLVERHQRSVWRVVAGLLGTGADAEDAAQDVFIAAFTHLASYDAGKAKFSTWLLTIARNRCVNVMNRRRPVAMADPPEQPEFRTPDVAAAEREWFAQLDAALASLPNEQKTAFVLAEIDELPMDEIARVEGVPLGTIKSRIARAKEKLRAALARDEQAEELR